MEIKLTQEQYKEMLEDEYLNIVCGDRHRMYVELDRDKRFWYFELIYSDGKGKTLEGYAHDVSELNKLEPKRPNKIGYYRQEPSCPNCSTSMIYHFKHCPECGQKLDWSEE